MMNRYVFLLVFLLVVCAGRVMAQTAGAVPVRIVFEMSTCRSFTVARDGALQEGEAVTSDYRITFEPETHRWGESVRKKGQDRYTSTVGRIQAEVSVTHRGNDICMRLTDHRGRVVLLNGDGRIYVYDTAKKGRIYTDTEGQNFLTLTDSDGRTMAKSYILGLRDMFRVSDYYRVKEIKEHLRF